MKGIHQASIALSGVVIAVGYAILALNIISLVKNKKCR